MEASKTTAYANGQEKGVEHDSAGDALTKDCGGFTGKSTLACAFRQDRDSCRALLPEGDFIEVYMDVLYKCVRLGIQRDCTNYQELEKSKVMARSSPMDKHTLVKHL